MWSAGILVGWGEVINYRKVHLSGAENVVFSPGTTLDVVAEIGGIKIGLLICADISYPEAARELALKGADLIIVPTAQAAPPELNGYSNHTIPSVWTHTHPTKHTSFHFEADSSDNREQMKMSCTSHT